MHQSFLYSYIKSAFTIKPSRVDSAWFPQMERVMGIEPTWPAWRAGVLPLNYTRKNTLKLNLYFENILLRFIALILIMETEVVIIGGDTRLSSRFNLLDTRTLKWFSSTGTKMARLCCKLLVTHRGFEPRISWLKIKCSANWANESWASFWIRGD